MKHSSIHAIAFGALIAAVAQVATPARALTQAAFDVARGPFELSDGRVSGLRPTQRR